MPNRLASVSLYLGVMGGALVGCSGEELNPVANPFDGTLSTSTGEAGECYFDFQGTGVVEINGEFVAVSNAPLPNSLRGFVDLQKIQTEPEAIIRPGGHYDIGFAHRDDDTPAVSLTGEC